METRPEVFDWQCKLFFYRSPDGDEQRFVAVADFPTRMVLRGVLASPVPTAASRGRLLGIRQGKLSPLWAEEARKVGVDPLAGFDHDFVLECRWCPDPIPAPAPVRAYWPSCDDIPV